MKKLGKLTDVVRAYALLSFMFIGAMDVGLTVAKVFMDKNN